MKKENTIREQLSTNNLQLTIIKKGWVVKEFDDCLEKVIYTKKIKRKSFLNKGLFPIVSQEKENINGYWDDEDDIFIVKRPIVIFGDHTKVIKFVDYDFVLGADGVKILNPINDIEPRYFFYYLQNINLGDLGYARHYRLLKDIKIQFPKSLTQQKQIVKILDQAFTAIDKAKNNAQQNLLNAKQLFESVLNGELLVVNGELKKDWTERTLEQIAETFGRGKSKHRPRNDKKLYGGNYPFIQTGDIRNSNHFITNYTQTYNEVGLAQSKLWPKGTICITIAANIAETGVLSFDACFPDSVIGIVVNPEFANIDFVEYLLQSFKVNLQSLSKGSAQDNLNLGTFKNKLFPFPPLKEQQKIVKKLNALQAQTKKLETIYEQKIIDLEELKKSILQKAFSGQLLMVSDINN